MSGHWWRAYEEALQDPKLLTLSDKLFRAWFNLLCIASKHGGILPAIEIVAIELRVSIYKAGDYIRELIKRGLFDDTEKGFAPHNWEERQYKTDLTDPTSSARQKRYRERKRNGDRNGESNGVTGVTPTVTHTVTPTVTRTVTDKRPDTESETDTETERKKDPSLREGTRARASRLPENWKAIGNDWNFALEQGLTTNDAALESEKFTNYWRAKSGRDATKCDWSATWRNWILRSIEMKGQANGARSGRASQSSPRSDFFAGLASVAEDIVRDSEVAGRAGEKIPPGRTEIDH